MDLHNKTAVKNVAQSAIPYVMLSTSLSSSSSTTRVIMPLASAEESKFLKNAMDGIRSLPGCEAAMMASSLDSSAANGGGGGIRTQWKKDVSTAASSLYRDYIKQCVAPIAGGASLDNSEIMRFIELVDKAEEEEAHFGQTLADRRYPPTPMDADEDEEEREQDKYRCFASNRVDRMPVFPLDTVPSSALVNLSTLMVQRSLVDTSTGGSYVGTEELLSSMNEDELRENAMQLMVASSFLQV